MINIPIGIFVIAWLAGFGLLIAGRPKTLGTPRQRKLSLEEKARVDAEMQLAWRQQAWEHDAR